MFLGAVSPVPFETTCVQWFGKAEQAQRPGALGHVLGINTYRPATTYVYYWGSGWSKADMPDMATWESYLKSFAERLRNPLQVDIHP